MWISVSLTFKPNHLVTEEEIKEYGENYLATFRKLVNRFSPEDRVYFPSFDQFWNRTMSLKATISWSHGAALEFILDSSSSTFESIRTDERIEVAMLNGVFSRQQGFPIPVSGSRILVFLESGVIFDWKGLCFFEVFDNASLVLAGPNWFLNGKHYTNPIAMKGSNAYRGWASDNATSDAQFDFKWDLAAALNASEGVREYLAVDELKNRLNNIAMQMKSNASYGPLEWYSDIAQLSEIAREKYGVERPNFINDTLNVLMQKEVFSKELPILQLRYDNDYVFTLFFSFMLDLSLLVTPLLDKLFARLTKAKQEPLLNVAKQLPGTITWMAVFAYFARSAPFGYDWFTHLTIVISQFLVLLIGTATLLRALKSGKLELRPNWRRLMTRLGFGALFLLVFLIVATLSASVFFSIPLMFSARSIAIGDVTLLSMLMATTALVVVVISQLVYNRWSPSNSVRGQHKGKKRS